MTGEPGRRRFLRATGAFSAGALFPALSAWAPSTLAQASDYRALVCVFLYGGNDGNNMVVPYDDYASYAAGRSGATGAAIDRGELVPIAPAGLARVWIASRSLVACAAVRTGQAGRGGQCRRADRAAHARGLPVRQAAPAQPVLP